MKESIESINEGLNNPATSVYYAAKYDPSRFIPGSSVYRYARMDKSDFGKLGIALDYTIYGVRDVGLALFEGALVYGLVGILEEAAKSDFIKNALDKLF